jgi:hypothetical protein
MHSSGFILGIANRYHGYRLAVEWQRHSCTGDSAAPAAARHNTLADSKKITKFYSESTFSIISSVSAIASASAVSVDALRYPEFHATTIFYIYRCESYKWFALHF